jgi:ADP-ribose pyrophosphatase
LSGRDSSGGESREGEPGGGESGGSEPSGDDRRTAPPARAPDDAPDDAPARILERRVAFTGRRLQVEVQRVRLPGGAEAELDILHHPGATAIVALLGPDVLLVRQYRHATGGWLLEVPAGTLEPGEPPAACAARELTEETGFRAGRLEALGWIWTTPGFTDERIWLFLATDLTPARQALDSDEVLALVRLPFADAVEQALRGELQDAKSIAALLQAAYRLRHTPPPG